jgi:hypothetical protein
MMNRVFVLGAGASAFAGYPLASGLWAFLREYKTNEPSEKYRRNSIIETLEPVLRKYSPKEPDTVDLEQIFTILDLAELGIGPSLLAPSEWRASDAN